uniref:DNA2/NAM7 helicase-like C-terminal domain-containing protein n=1 Tax=Ditylenchus dipsaci TaxID=166011 RepID=A0A915DX13_9BILA
MSKSTEKESVEAKLRLGASGLVSGEEGRAEQFHSKEAGSQSGQRKAGEKLSSVQEPMALVLSKGNKQPDLIQVSCYFPVTFNFYRIFLEEADLQAPQINNQREAKLRSGAYGLDLTEAKNGLEITVDVSVEVSEVTEIQDSRLHAKNEETSVPQPVFIVNQNRQPAPIAQKPRLRGHYVEKELKGHVAKDCPLPCKNCLRILKVETPRCECVCGAGKMRSVSLIRGPSLPFITRYRQLSNSLPPRVEDIESQWIPANFPRSYNVRLQNTLLSDIFSSKRCAFELTYPSMDESGKKKMVSTDMFGLVHCLSSKLIQVHVNSTDLLGLVKRSPAGFTEYYFPDHSEMFVRPMSSHGLYKQYAKNIGEKSAKSCIWRLRLDLRCLVPDFDENLYAMNSNEMEPQMISKLPPSQINREELLETARNLTQLFGFNDRSSGHWQTRVAACVALAYYLLGGTVLCVAVTNSAVNHLLEVVVEMVQIFHGEDITAPMAQFVNKTVRIFADYLESSYSLEHSDLEIKDEQVAEILQMTPPELQKFSQHNREIIPSRMRLVFTTLHKVSSVHFKNSYHFDVILMDEASYSPDASGKIYKKNVMICNKPISNLTLFGDQEQGLGIVCKDCPDIEGRTCSQVDLIATKLRELSGALRKIKVFTVDEFQGRESDVVLVSLARSDGLGFLRDRFITATGRQSNLRINVGTTRAREVVCLLDTRTSSSLITYQCQRMKVTQNAFFHML